MVRPSDDLRKRERLMEWLKDQFDYYKKAFPIGIPMYLEDLKWSWNTYINNLTALGIYLTLGYTLFMVDILGTGVLNWIQEKVVDNKLNEVGDFLAGLFGPVAFGWLIIGYLMQNIELKNSVAEANATNDLNRDNFNFNKLVKEYEVKKEHNDNQPLFGAIANKGKFSINGKLKDSIEISITNHGARIVNVASSDLYKVSQYSYSYNHLNNFDTVERNRTFKFIYELDDGLGPLYDNAKNDEVIGKFFVYFTDGLNSRGFIEFKLIVKITGIEKYLSLSFFDTTKKLPMVC